MRKILVKNVGKIVSGDLKKGIIPGDAILIENGIFTGVGKENTLNTKDVESVIDARGMVVIPGLIETHAHAWMEDYYPGLQITDWMKATLLAGVTTLISARTQLMGEKAEPPFAKAMAILGQTKWAALKPGNYLKVHGGTLSLVDNLTESDIKEVAEQGVHLVSEIGVGGTSDLAKMKQYIEWCRKYGLIVSIHFGGRMVPGSFAPSAEVIIDMNPDFVAHINGGPTAPPLANAKKLVEGSQCYLECVFNNGNIKMGYEVANMLIKRGELHRLIFGTDSPTGGGWMPLGIHNLIAHLASFNGVPAQDAIACATGNSANCFKLNTGRIEVGREADLVVIDAPLDSAGKDALEAIEIGDLPGQAMVMVDGHLAALWGKATRRPRQQVLINGIEYKYESFQQFMQGEQPRLDLLLQYPKGR
jgi:enamidase